MIPVMNFSECIQLIITGTASDHTSEMACSNPGNGAGEAIQGSTVTEETSEEQMPSSKVGTTSASDTCITKKTHSK